MKYGKIALKSLQKQAQKVIIHVVISQELLKKHDFQISNIESFEINLMICTRIYVSTYHVRYLIDVFHADLKGNSITFHPGSNSYKCG